MPFCDISNDVSLYYITNTPKGDVSDLDHDKPTVILIPPLFTAVPWLREQFGDPRLSGRYNLIAFDLRNMGQARAPLNHRRDGWVDAADLAVAHELLQLPPCHLFTTVMPSCMAGLSFAALFPAKCLSLCLCTVPTRAGDDPEWVLRGYHDLLEAWCFPSDLETYERACLELSNYMFNGQATTELEDEMVAWWQMNLSPRRRTSYLAQALVALNRHRLSDKILGSINLPTLVVQGDKAPVDPIEAARELNDKILNSRLFIVQGGPRFVTVVPGYASVVNRAYSQFLADLPHSAGYQPSQPDPEGVSKAALERLAVFMDDPSIAQRDSTSTLSFSLLSQEVIKKNICLFEKFSRGEKDALNPLDDDGQPIRKFSERHKEQWSPAAFERMKQPLFSDVAVMRVVESSHE